MKSVLLVNDDGYEAAGIWAMQRALVKNSYDVTFVAPKTGQSWAGKSMLHNDEVTHEIQTIHHQEVHIIDATPAACVRIALYDILENKPDLVVSGINYGGNHSLPIIFSSGTFGAALEAAFDGLPALAVSLSGAPYPIDDSVIKAFDKAADLTVEILKKLDESKLPEDVDLLNLNIPYQIKNEAVVVCKNSRPGYTRLYNKHKVNSTYSKITTEVYGNKLEPDSDTYYLKKEGRPTLTPINLDLASSESISRLKKFFNQ